MDRGKVDHGPPQFLNPLIPNVKYGKIEISMGQNSPYVWVYSSDRLKHSVLVTLILSLDVVLTSICWALIFSILPEPIRPDTVTPRSRRRPLSGSILSRRFNIWIRSEYSILVVN